MHNLKFSNKLISLFVINTKKNKLWFDIILTKNILTLCLIFQSTGLITSFFIFKKNTNLYLKIFIKYINLELASGFPLHFFFKPSHKLSISLRNLKKFNRRSGSSSLIISTSKGLKTHQDCLRLNLSGYLYSVIYC